MANSNLQIAAYSANQQAAALNTAGGTTAQLFIYSGAQASNTANMTANAAASTLAALTLNATASFVVSNGQLIANATNSTIPSVSILNTGTASWFRVCANTTTAPAGANAVLFQGSVGTTGNLYDLGLNSTALSSGATLTISSFSFTVPYV